MSYSFLKQCEARLSDGRQCPNAATPGSRYCSQHRYLEPTRAIAGLIGGAVIGDLFAPGIGAVIGGIVGLILSSTSTSRPKPTSGEQGPTYNLWTKPPGQ